MKILIVDDSATQRLIVRSIVDNYDKNFETIEVTDGRGALEYINKGDIKLVFSDINMEPMSGTELVAEVNKTDIECIFAFITSHLTESMQDQAKELGVQYYLTKPITQEKIENVLKEVFSD
ncbi:hypothetical protein A9Q84_19145 [Halobacteriovorax marinus]|uniref:Response regulatory domain-containing protein n=1 Tax=Halobacteriovorax marinus TaxID=97084 RepID=A0A1Y5F2B5_9BACT|nr:hypothetical protein A9Q84_19145 [Halobacteriovorax marinus]